MLTTAITATDQPAHRNREHDANRERRRNIDHQDLQ